MQSFNRFNLIAVTSFSVGMASAASGQDGATSATRAKAPTPLSMNECEQTDRCSTWTFLGAQEKGQGPAGEVENLSIEKFDATTLIVHRSDSTGASAGLTADTGGTP
jgi:hypothetical protein